MTLDDQTLSVQVIEATTANGVCTMRIKAVALPGAVATALDESADLIRMTLASSAAPSSVEQPAAELSPDSRAAEGDKHTDTATAAATDIHTDTSVIKDVESQKQPQPGRLDSPVNGSAAARHTGVVDYSPTAAVVSGSSGQNHANGLVSSSSSTAHGSFTHGSSSDNSSSIDSKADMAEDPNDAERLEAPSLGRGIPSLESATASRGDLHGSKGSNSGTGEASPSVDRVKEAAGSVNDAHQQSEEEEQSVAPGKVRMLKQRLLAAVKEATADSPALLKVSFTSPSLLLQSRPPPPAPPPSPPPAPLLARPLVECCYACTKPHSSAAVHHLLHLNQHSTDITAQRRTP